MRTRKFLIKGNASAKDNIIFLLICLSGFPISLIGICLAFAYGPEIDANVDFQVASVILFFIVLLIFGIHRLIKISDTW